MRGRYKLGECDNSSDGGYIFSESDIVRWCMDYTRKSRPIIYNEENDINGMVYTKSYPDDDSYYAPYLVYKIGVKLKLDVPRTELGDVAHRSEDSVWTWRNSFSNSSIIYDLDKFGKGKPPFWWRPRWDYVHPAVIEEKYFLENPSINEERRKTPIRSVQQMVRDYVDSAMFFLTTRGSKDRDEYTNVELDEMKQELIDRLLFGLRFGINGVSEIKLKENSNARLDSYYLASDNMLFLRDSERGVKEYIEMSDDEFQGLLDRSDTWVYTNLSFEEGDGQPTSKDIIKNVYENYPEQAKNFFKRLGKLTENDIEAILEECIDMSPNHKKLALRAFKMRGQIYDQIHQQHMKTQESMPTGPNGEDR